MMNQSNAKTAILLQPSPSSVPPGIANTSSLSHTPVAIKDTKGMADSINITILISFQF